MANRVIDILGSYNLGRPGSSLYRRNTGAIIAALTTQLLAPLTTRVFIDIDGQAGSATGGGGDGQSIATAYRVRHHADMQTLWASIKGSGNIELLFPRGKILRPSAAGGAQGLSTGVANVRIGTYGPRSAGRFEFTAFLPVTSLTVVTPMATSDGLTYTITVAPGSPVIRWVRVGEGFDQQLARVYMRVASTAAMPARSWYYNSGTQLLTIRRDDAQTDPVLTATEVAIATGTGLELTNHDMQAVVGVTGTGWGLETDNSQKYQLQSLVTGTKLTGDFDCEWYWGSHHLWGHLVSGAGNSGGTHITRGARAGLGVQHSSGMTAYISFANDGAQECVMVDYTATHGSLRTNTYNTNTNGAPWYIHTSSTTLPFAFRFRRNCVALQDAVNGFSDANLGDCAPAVTQRCDLSQYADWAEGDVIEWSLPDIDGFVGLGGTYKYMQGYRCRWSYTSATPAGALRNVSILPASGQWRHCMFNLNTSSWSGKNCNIFSAAGTCDIDFINSAVTINKQTSGDTYLLGANTSCRSIRSVMQSSNANFTTGIPNTVATLGITGTHTGGFVDTAQINIKDTVTNATRLQTLLAMVDYTARDHMRLPSGMRNVTNVPLSGETEQVPDLTGRVPRADLAALSIGPVEHWANYRPRTYWKVT